MGSGGDGVGCGGGRVVFADVCDREEGVGAVAALVDAVVAVAPFSFVAVVTLPVAGISPSAADVTEYTGF